MSKDPLPNNWHWGAGEIAGGSKTYWFYTNLRFHYRGELYTDPNKDWTVNFYEETGLTELGDIIVSEYPCRSATFESESDALIWLGETAAELM